MTGTPKWLTEPVADPSWDLDASVRFKTRFGCSQIILRIRLLLLGLLWFPVIVVMRRMYFSVPKRMRSDSHHRACSGIDWEAEVESWDSDRIEQAR